MSVEVARTPIYPQYPKGFDALDSSSGDTDEFIKSVKDSLQRGRYDTKVANNRFAAVDSEDEQPSLPMDEDVDAGSLGQGENSLTEVMELPISDDEESRWVSPNSLHNALLQVKQTSPGVEDLIMNYPNEGVKEDKVVNGDKSQSPAHVREEKDLLSMVLDEIPDYPSNSAKPLLRSADIVNLSVRQKMQQELQNSRESVLQMEQLHQQDIAKLKEMLEAVKSERRSERSQLQQKINSLQKDLEASKRKMKNMGRDHVILLERSKEAEQAAQRIEVDNIQNKMIMNHEQDINKLKKAHRTEILKLQQLIRDKEQELKLSNQELHEEREVLASVKLQLEECRRDNHIKLNKMKSEIASKTEEYNRQMKREKSLAVSKALEEATLQKNKELHELQLKCQDDKAAALNKMEKKFTAQLEEVQKREQEIKRDHLTTPTQEGGVNNKHLEKMIQDHAGEKIKWQQKVHQLEQELQQSKNKMRLMQQEHKEASHQHDKENKAVAMEIMEECHKMSTLLMKRLRSGKKSVTSCWAAVVQLKNTNEELANEVKELRTRLEQEKQSAVKTNRERLTEIRKLQKRNSHKGKSYEELQLEKRITALNNQLMILNKEHLLLEAEVNKLRT